MDYNAYPIQVTEYDPVRKELLTTQSFLQKKGYRVWFEEIQRIKSGVEIRLWALWRSLNKKEIAEIAAGDYLLSDHHVLLRNVAKGKEHKMGRQVKCKCIRCGQSYLGVDCHTKNYCSSCRGKRGSELIAVHEHKRRGASPAI